MKTVILSAGGIAGALLSIFALVNVLGFTPVFASEFKDFKQEYYEDELEEAEDELTDIEIDIYREEKQTGDVPPFLIKKKKDLENEIDKIKGKIPTAEDSE